MRSLTNMLTVAAIMALTAGTAHASITVEYSSDGSSWTFASNTGNITWNETTRTITIINANAAYWRIKTTNPTVENIDDISFSGNSSSGSFNVIVGDGSPFPSATPLTTAGCNNLRSFHYGVGNVALSIRTNNYMGKWAANETAMNISATRIGSLYAGTTFYAGVTHNPGSQSGIGALGLISGATIDASAVIRSYNNSGITTIESRSGDNSAGIITDWNGTTRGNIGTVRATGGRFLGSINPQGGIDYTPTGTINEVSGDTGIGTATTPVKIRCSGGITTLRAGTVTGSIGGDMYLDAECNTMATGTDGRVRSVRVVKANGVGGNFYGTLKARTMFNSTGAQDRIVIDANNNGKLIFTSTLGANDLILIGGSHSGTAAEIDVLGSLTGLTGQVIIGDNGFGTATWTQPVKIGPTGSSVTLSPTPAYNQTSASLGGGAVGLAPFQMHVIDSKPTQPANPPYSIMTLTPVHKATWLSTPDTISAQFYGPLLVGQAADTDVDPSLLGLKVWYCPLSSFDENYPGNVDVTSKFRARVPAGAMNRRVFLRPKCAETYLDLNNNIGGVYRATKNSGGLPANSLRCKYVGTAGFEPEVAPFSLYFRFWCSDADLGQTGGVYGGDGNLDNNDFVVFIDMFNNQNPIADMGAQGGVPGHDGIWDNNDFIVYIDKFYAGCDTTALTCLLGDGTGDPGAGAAVMASIPPAIQGAADYQRELDALLAVFRATGDPRIIDRINALTGTADR